jgi:hypothetical protein
VREREKRFATEVLLTATDVAVLDGYCGDIRRASPRALRKRRAVPLMIVLVGTADAGLRIHACYDIRRIPCERILVHALKRLAVAREVGRDVYV